MSPRMTALGTTFPKENVSITSPTGCRYPRHPTLTESTDMDDRIKSHNFERTAPESDAGAIYEVTCPKCKDQITVGEYSSWWDQRCSCGYVWDIVTVAVGRMDNHT